MAFKWLDLFFFKWWDVIFFKFFNININTHAYRGYKTVDKSEQSDHLLPHTSLYFALDGSVDKKDDSVVKKRREINWLDIPDHLLALITEKLIYNKDFIQVGAVCKLWRAIYVEYRHLRLPRQLPLLMLPSEDDPTNNQTRSLYSLSEKRLYNTQLSVPHNQFCRGSCEGWLITVHENLLDVRLYNPFLSIDNEIQLPPLTVFPHIEREIFNEGFLTKAVLSANPAKDPNYVIMAIFGQCNRLAFLKPGDKIWTPVEPNYSVMEDMIYYKEQFYAVNFFGAVFACDVNDAHPKVLEIAKPPNENFISIKKYLVVSSGDLLQIRKLIDYADEGSYCTHGGAYCTHGFEVFKLDLLTRNWTEVKSLPGQTLFLGDNSSMSLSSPEFPGCKGNCIYFTDDFYEDYMDENDDPHDMGIFHFEDGSFEPHYPMKGKTIFPPPIWIEPVLL